MAAIVPLCGPSFPHPCQKFLPRKFARALCCLAGQMPKTPTKMRNEELGVRNESIPHSSFLIPHSNPSNSKTAPIDWLRVARTVLTSRAIDRIEEQEMTPKGLVTYQ